LDVRVDTTASDETGVLVEAFNRMADSLRRQREDLRRRTDYIEKILRSATTGVVSIEGSGTIITINPAAQGLLTGSLGAPEAGSEIVRSGRLAAWAEMARRVAHEIKNPLTPIQLSIEHVRRVFKAKDPRFETIFAECLNNIQRQVAVLREIAVEFSAYARLPQLRPEPVAVEALVDEALGPYIAAAPPGVRITREVGSDVPPVHVDR